MTTTQTGRVIKSTGSWYIVINQNGDAINCRLKGLFRTKGIRTTNPIAVGDIVDITTPDNNNSAVIVKIHERKNYIIRKATNLSKATHIIAANIDQVVIIASLVQPRTSTGFIDRILTTAEAYHIPAIIIFNKLDLYDTKTTTKLNELITVYEKAGYKCLTTSVTDKLNISDFKNILINKTSLLSGHSGVGKSALINSVDSNLNLKTGKISTMHNKGTHTTTFANMFNLDFGGYVIDTPGIKEFGLVEFDKNELGHRFPEIRNLMHDCRFSNCIHVNEPGCAVLQALQDGDLASFRYENYFNMLNSIS